MNLILALDPAWTTRHPSGVALVARDGADSMCLGLAPSYRQFVDLSSGQAVDWTERPPGGLPPVDDLLESARLIAGKYPDMVTVDMPVSRSPITGRRVADNAISRAFGARGCSTHSPSTDRPGEVGAHLTTHLFERGYELLTTSSDRRRGCVLVEVYPHPALLVLMQRDYQVPYKVSRRNKYWKDVPPAQRKSNLVTELVQIFDRLRGQIDGLDATWLKGLDLISFEAMKRYEDTLDALVCAWVGVKILEGAAKPYGDDEGAVWVPI